MHVVATAGHVDHGKSTLVRALTGMEPDRFAEERRRGMTIDLGFAWTTLEAAGEVSFVDVPGHQRFIANMLAGLGPAPVVLFVVAADAGWSAQSADHLAVIDALQIRHGVLAVTRSDLADPTDALADARARIAATSLGSVPAVAVSGATGAGLAHLRGALDEVLTSRAPAPRNARVRLWVDRSFSVRGSGTVVTGTLGAGSVSAGDELQLAERRVGVRGIQTNGASRTCVSGPVRAALNLRNVDHADVVRGDALLTPGAWHVGDLVDVRVRPATDLPREVLLHIGTAAVAAHVRALGAGFARLRLTRPLPLAPGDRGVLRDPGRQVAGAGIEVLDVDPPQLVRRGSAARRADELAAADGLPSTADHVLRRQVVTRTELARLGVPPDASTGDDRVRAVGDLLVAEAAWQGWLGALTATVAGWAARDPLQPHPTPAAVRDRIGLPPRYPDLLAALVDAAGVRVVDARLAPDVATSATALPPGVAALVGRLTGSAFDAPTRDDLRELGLGRRELAAAAKAGVLLVLAADTGDVVLLPDAPERAAAVLAAAVQPFTVSAARQTLGSTRRVVVPLLEELDRLGHTERVDALTRAVRTDP